MIIESIDTFYTYAKYHQSIYCAYRSGLILIARRYHRKSCEAKFGHDQEVKILSPSTKVLI